MDELRQYLDKSVKIMTKYLNVTEREAREYLALELSKEKAKHAKNKNYKMRQISDLIKEAAEKFPERPQKKSGAGLVKPYDFMPGYQTPEQDAKNKYHL